MNKPNSNFENKSPTQRTRWPNSGRATFALLLTLSLMVSFQNCSGGFKAQLPNLAAVDSSSSDLTSADPTPAPTPYNPLMQNAWEPPANLAAKAGTFIEVDWVCSTGMQMNYRLLLPANYDPNRYRYPLVTILHSAGIEVLTDNSNFDEQVGSIFNIESSRQQFPSFVLAPQGPAGDTWGQSFSGSTQAGDCGRELVHQVVQKYSIDTKRVYLTGGWDGGSGTWDWLARESNFFAAGIPQGGSVTDSTFATNLVKMPIWAFYGQFIYGGGHQDHITAMVTAIESLGGNQVKFTENPLGDPAGMYGPWNVNPLRPGVLTWLYSQRHL